MTASVIRLCALTAIVAAAGRAAAQTSDEWQTQVDRAAALHRLGKNTEAEAAWTAALQRAGTFDPGDERLPRALNNLGAMQYERGRYSEAEPLFRRALSLWERIEGPDGVNATATLANLAELCRVQGRYDEAEPLYAHVLHLREAAVARRANTLKPDAPELLGLATTRNNLATLYHLTGRPQLAEPLLRSALEIRERAHGPDSPAVAAVLNNLGTLCGDWNRPDEAERLFRRAVAIRESQTPRDAPALANTLGNLGGNLRQQGNLEAAEPVLKRALQTWATATGGLEHPSAAAAMNNLAQLYAGQRRFAEAGPLLRRALDVSSRTSGANHDNTSAIMCNLAAMFREEEKYAAAEQMYRRALAAREAAHGPSHPLVAQGLEALAQVHFLAGRYSEAEEGLRGALAIRERTGAQSSDLTGILTALADLYSLERRMDRAGPLYERSALLAEQSRNAPQLSTSLAHWAAALRRNKQNREASEVEQRLNSLAPRP